MEYNELDTVLMNRSPKLDSTDTPDCFGDYNSDNRLCKEHCAISIKCCVHQAKHPKVDILEKLLIHNHYAVKPH